MLKRSEELKNHQLCNLLEKATSDVVQGQFPNLDLNEIARELLSHKHLPYTM